MNQIKERQYISAEKVDGELLDRMFDKPAEVMEEPEYEQRLNDMFCEAFETNHPAMHDWVLIKMELRSLRNDTKKEENDGRD